MLPIFALFALSHLAPSVPVNGVVATYVPICRDSRGSWDRRACKHESKKDPHRLVVAVSSLNRYSVEKV